MRLTAAQWLAIMAALAAAYAALLFGQQALPGRYGAYLGIAVFVALPLIALRLTAKADWTALFHRPTARDLGVGLACAPLTLVVSAAVAVVLLQVGETAPNPAAAMLHKLQGAERIACVFNMSGERHVFGDARLDGGQMLPAGPGEARLDGGALHLGPYAARFVKVG